MIQTGGINYGGNKVSASMSQHQTPGSSYIGELMDLYKQYFSENLIDKLLIKKIQTVNIAIKNYIQDRDKNSYLLFSVSDYDEAIIAIQSLKENAEFLISALSFLTKVSKDKKLRVLMADSISVTQDFVIKLMDYSNIYSELKNFEGEVDEDSEEYKNKMAEIADYIISNDRKKTGNSILELLGLQSKQA